MHYHYLCTKPKMSPIFNDYNLNIFIILTFSGSIDKEFFVVQ